ncbi:tetratricopeptide repeat protein, partial [Photobacterium sanctipauli]
GHHIDGGLIFDEVKQRKLLPSDGVFICVTGDNSRQVVTHFIELEPDDYLIKPFSAATLTQRINSVLVRKSALYPLLLAVDNKEFNMAIDLCHRYKTKYPKYKSYIDRLNGDCLLRADRHNEAREFYRQACEEYEHLWPQIGLGQALIGLGELSEAETVFDDILSKYPKQPVARKHLAGCFMASGKIPEALAQFKFLHKVNSANPLRELVIANLYAVLQQHSNAAVGYQRYISKVKGTSRFSYGINVNIPVSLLLASIYCEDSKTRDELVNEARSCLHELNHGLEPDVEGFESEVSSMVGVAILACLQGDIENCFTIVSRINLKEKPVRDFYTVLNVARIYAFCGMPDLYEQTMQLARELCGHSDDATLVQSQVKLLEACHSGINNRLKEGGELVERAFALREANQGKQAIKVAYRAFHMVPYHYQLCYLILELTALATPSFLNPVELRSVITSCHWVFTHDTRPSKDETLRANELYQLSLARIEKRPSVA